MPPLGNFTLFNCPLTKVTETENDGKCKIVMRIRGESKYYNGNTCFDNPILVASLGQEVKGYLPYRAKNKLTGDLL